MGDGGQGFFKLSMAVLPSNYIPEVDPENEDFEENNNSYTDNVKGKRSLYSEGGSVGKRAKLTSVKRLILLCVVPSIKETYENLNNLFKLTELNDIPFRFVADFKVLLIVNGQQTASATYPCPYCFVTLQELRGTHRKNESGPSHRKGVSSDDEEIVPKLKTYGDLKNDYQKYCATGKIKKYASECRSTINLSLFEEDDEIKVIEKCSIPELHILQGFLIHLFWNRLVPLLGESTALNWPKKLNVITKNYHGRVFEGNVCRKMIKNAYLLGDKEICGKVGHFKITAFISAFRAINEVVDCCFTSGKVGSSLSNLLKSLCMAIEDLKFICDVSESLKIHVLKEHILESLETIENSNGLGYWSEQAGEAIHHHFMEIWNCYKINDIGDTRYAIQLHKAIVELSSLNL